MKDHFGSTYEIDTTVARSPRVYDYLLGGSNNFAVDREAAERSFACLPGGVEAAGAMARANRTFQARAIREVVSNAAVRQVLSIDTGIPYADNVHEVTQRTVPETRVVFVDSDPIVLAHAHALQRSTPEGAAAYVQGDLRDPETILRTAAKTLDLTEPVAVTLTMILHLLPDEANPYGIVDQLMGAVPPGSYLVISHLADDIQPRLPPIFL